MIGLLVPYAIGVLLTRSVLLAQATKVSYDWSTPTRAFVALMESYRVGDVVARRESYHAANNQERAFLEAVIDEMEAGLELQRAWAARYANCRSGWSLPMRTPGRKSITSHGSTAM
jgi:hypothetical protein